MQQKYGADITKKQFILLVIALCSGTVIEWLDFTVYSQLSAVITRLFFPSNDPTVKQLAFWAVFAMGFVSRPFGAIIFGHIGDAVGRRITMLLSVSCIVLPTAIIGCLPTYQQAGLVAPVLMAILRFIQGLAVGGEFGSAIVYLVEMAPVGRKGLIASLGVMSLGPGIIFGTIAVLIVTYACTPAQLDLWGWRIPFLLSVVVAPIAIMLRRALPEPTEFINSKQKLTEQRVASIAIQRVASSIARQQSGAASALSPRRLSASTLFGSRKLQSFNSWRAASVDEDIERPTPVDQQSNSSFVSASSPHLVAHVVDAADADELSRKQPVSPRLAIRTTATPLLLPVSTAAGDQVSSPARAGGGAFFPAIPESRSSPFLQAAMLQQHQEQFQRRSIGVAPEIEKQFANEVQQVRQTVKRHIPVVDLFRRYWLRLLLMILFEAVYASSFFVFFSWLPSYLVASKEVTAVESLWIILIGMVLFTITVPISGHYLVDKGGPKIWSFLGLALIVGAVAIPIMIGIATRARAAVWLLPPLMLALNGLLAGLMTSIGPQLYEPGVRTSGYNLGHNVSFAVFGGLSPFMVSALAVGLYDRPHLAAGVIIDITAGLTCIAGLALAYVAPHVNVRGKNVAAVPEAAAGAANTTEVSSTERHNEPV